MSRVMPSVPAAIQWSAVWRQAGLILLLVLTAILAFYRETALAMVDIWQRSETFAHAFGVPPIALWLIWQRRAELALLTPRPSFGFALPLALAAVAWLLGELVAVNALTQAALVAMLVLSVPLVLGWSVARQISFPLVFLFFAVPVGEFMLPTLMELTADFTVTALRLSGIPVYREGLQFIIPSGSWSVVEACSGLRYLIASVMVGTLFAYLNYQSWRRRLVFIVIATLLPLLANWVRAYMIVMLGHLSSNKLAAGADHLIYGWVFFGVIMLALFMIGARWSEPDPLSSSGAALAASTIGQPVWPAALITVFLAIAPLLALSVLDVRIGRPQLDLPVLAAWQAEGNSPADWKPVFVRPAAELQRTYVKGGYRVGLHLAYFRQQGYGSKLISSSNHLVASSDKHWSLVGSGTRTVTLGQEELLVRSTGLRAAGQLGAPGERLEVWQFYWVGGRLTSSDLRAKLLGAVQRLRGQGDDAASVIIYTRKDADNDAAAEQILKTFIEENWADIAEGLERTRASAR